MEDGGEHWLSFEAGACVRCCAFAARNSCRVLSDYGKSRIKVLCTLRMSL